MTVVIGGITFIGGFLIGVLTMCIFSLGKAEDCHSELEEKK